ncbi:RICIN domain-containing protein [Streptomyces qinzhouensis]|nr:RICIN domain-containing protein [Streptomyces qinzhouensis]
MGGQGLPEQDWIADGLREVLGGGELSARKQARVEGNRPRHHIVAVALNAFARFGQSAELTELEQEIVDAFRRAGISDAQIAEYGRIFTEASAEAKARAFPDVVAGLTPETGYGTAELQRDAPTVVRDVLDLPHVQLEERAPGQARVGPSPADTPAATNVGWSATILQVPQEASAAAFAAPPPAPPVTAFAAPPAGQTLVTVWADNFYCEKESTELSPDDELYFNFVTTDRSNSTTVLPPTIENVDAGETHSFTNVILWNQAVAPWGLIVTVDVWEEDSGNNRSPLAAAQLEAAKEFAASLRGDTLADALIMGAQLPLELADGYSFSPLVAAVTMGISAVIETFISWSYDDHVGTHAFAFASAALTALGPVGSPSTYEGVIDGSSNGEARIRLRIRADQGSPGRRIRLTNVNSGKILTVHGASLDDGANVDQWHYHSGENQHWRLVDKGNGVYALLNERSGQALSVYGGSVDDSANIVQWPYGDTDNQHWRLEDTGNGFKVINVRSGKVLDVYGRRTDDGTNVIQYTYSQTANQHWRINDI